MPEEQVLEGEWGCGRLLRKSGLDPGPVGFGVQTASPQLAQFAGGRCHAWGDAGEPLQPLALGIPRVGRGRAAPAGSTAMRGTVAPRISLFLLFF